MNTNRTPNYIISFTCETYDFHMITIQLPLYFANKPLAELWAKNTKHTFTLTKNRIVICSSKKLPIYIEYHETHLYYIEVLKESKKEKLGKPLSIECIEHLREIGTLEDVIFSDEYIISPSDYEIAKENLNQLYNRLSRKYRKECFLMETSSYGVEPINYK